MHRPRTVNRRDWRVGGGVEGHTGVGVGAAGGRVRFAKTSTTGVTTEPRVGGMCGWPTFHFWTIERLRAGPWAREGRWYYVEGERQLISAAGSPPTLLPCQAGHLSVTGGAQVLRGLASGTGVPAHPGPLVFLPARLLAESETRRLNHARGCPLLPGCLKSGGRSRSPAPMESVDRWPLASLLLQIPGGAAPREPPFVGVSAGLDPPPEGRMPQPASACKGDSWPGLPACGPVPGATVGAIGWSSVYSRCAGGVAVAGHFVCPFQSEAYVTRCLFGGFGNSVNHRVFERTLRPLVFPGHACPSVIAALKPGLCVGSPSPLRGDGPERQRRHRVRSLERMGLVTCSVGLAGACRRFPNHSFQVDLGSVGIPAELKHINKRRKRNQPDASVTASEAARAQI
ncbi:hypothetical protein AAWM_08777 [Aspergillus awamori]|uniref:Uncharacterized protein n=1 Tax=Aspergillus awamori TaxID=105351 RepID=A0A401L314_ASPAW|nr:hypothetical protein AAWM_08777 [Aspergillus awamori]